MRRLLDPAGDELSEGDNLPRLPSICFGTGREHNLNLLRGLFGVSNSKWISGSAESRNHQPRGTVAQRQILIKPIARSPERAQKILCFSVDKDWVENRVRQAGPPIGSTR